MTVKVVKGFVPNTGELAPSTQESQVISQSKIGVNNVATLVGGSPDAVVNTVRQNRAEKSGLGGLKSLEKADKLASDVKERVAKDGSGEADDAHTGLRSSNASYHLNA